MNRATTEMRKFARRLVEYEALEDQSLGADHPATFQVSDELRLYLSTLMGTGGFRALHARALTLAAAEVPWLKAVHIRTDGSLGGLEEAHAKLDPDDFAEGRVALLAHLLGLMTAFIGEILTLRLMREVWPKIPLNDLDFGHGDKNEEAK